MAELKESLPLETVTRLLQHLVPVVDEIVANKQTKEIFSAEAKAPDTLRCMALDYGLSLYARRTNNGRYGDWVMTSPPLITTTDQVDDMIERYGQLFGAFTDAMVRDGVKVG